MGGSLASNEVHAADDAPFAPLIGWWKGEGRLGFQEGQTENVSCRATYGNGDSANTLEQNIRCASSSGKVEIESTIINDGGKLSGTWTERIYNLAGDLSGAITERGYRVSVAGSELSAEMEIIAKNGMQVIEIKFNGNALRGLTLVLKKG
jgi:hypothetical protein